MTSTFDAGANEENVHAGPELLHKYTLKRKKEMVPGIYEGKLKDCTNIHNLLKNSP